MNGHRRSRLILWVSTALLFIWSSFVSGNVVEIEFWYPVGNASTQEWLEYEVLPAFRAEHPDINVTISLMSNFSDYEEKLIVGHATGVAPDVFMIPGRGPDEYMGLGMIAPLAEFVDRWGEQADYIPTAWAGVTFAGAPYAIPWSVQGPILAGHGRLFTESGLAAAIPETWEEFSEAARRLSRIDGDALRRIGILPANHHYFYPWLHTAGGELFNEEGTQALLNQAPGLEALTFLVDLHQLMTQGFPHAGLNFNNQLAAMQFAEPNVIANLTRQDPEAGRGVIVGPTPRKERHAGRVYVPSLAVWSNSPNQDAAWKWLSYLQRPEHLLTYNAIFGRIPPRLSLLHPDNFEAVPQLMEYGSIYVTYGIPHRFPPARGQELFGALNSALQGAFSGNISPQEALDRATHEWNVIIQTGL